MAQMKDVEIFEATVSEVHSRSVVLPIPILARQETHIQTGAYKEGAHTAI